MQTAVGRGNAQHINDVQLGNSRTIYASTRRRGSERYRPVGVQGAPYVAAKADCRTRRCMVRGGRPQNRAVARLSSNGTGRANRKFHYDVDATYTRSIMNRSGHSAILAPSESRT